MGIRQRGVREIFLGVAETKTGGPKARSWNGFADKEAAQGA